MRRTIEIECECCSNRWKAVVNWRGKDEIIIPREKTYCLRCGQRDMKLISAECICL